MTKRFAGLAFAVVLAGCGENLATIGAPSEQASGAKQGEAWDSSNNPSMFASDLQYTYSALPLEGQAQTIPWAGSYWPVASDSINYRWAGPGSDSAPMKYQKAYGGTNLEDAVSAQHGIDAFTSQKACTGPADCTGGGSAEGSCSMRPGATTGRCIPGWWGICHAWSPASILLPEPQHAVIKNGITFEVQDLKALATLVHNSTSSRFVSLRCNETGTSAVDAYGRIVASDCRDTNAGTFHLLVTNYLGLRRQAFVEDRVAAAEVWNQPLRGYHVVSQRPVSASEANTLIGALATGGTTVNRSGTVAQNAWSQQGSFPVEAGSLVQVVMSGSGDADLYVRFGAAPDESTYTCRPYAGSSAETCSLTVPAGETQVFVGVRGYAPTSDFSLAITTGARPPSSYVFNSRAASFVAVTLDLQYISESTASTGNTGAVIDQYTGTDRYDYLLELDAAGKIIGGEWTGASKQSHPDFLWLPTGVATSSVAQGKISYATVKALVMESVSAPPAPADAGTAGTQNSFSDSQPIAAQAWRIYGPFSADVGSSVVASLTGTGDADLYVKVGMAPTATSYDCRPYTASSAESCTVTASGPVYVGVNGFAASSTYSLTVTWRGGPYSPPPVADAGVPVVDAGAPPAVDAGAPDAGQPVDPGDGGIAQLNESGTLTQGQLRMFTLPLAAGRTVVVRTQAPHDVDLYLRAGVAPTTSTFDQRAWTTSGNETLTFVAGQSTTLFIGVYGYAASSFTLTTSDQ